MIAFSALDGESIFLLRDYINELLVYVVHRHVPLLSDSFAAGWPANADACFSASTCPPVSTTRTSPGPEIVVITLMYF